jgi:hypothetical protein
VLVLAMLMFRSSISEAGGLSRKLTLFNQFSLLSRFPYSHGWYRIGPTMCHIFQRPGRCHEDAGR